MYHIFFHRNEYPPVAVGENSTVVYVDVDIYSVGSFEEIAMTFDVKFTLKLEWFDGRLVFYNLKVCEI